MLFFSGSLRPTVAQAQNEQDQTHTIKKTVKGAPRQAADVAYPSLENRKAQRFSALAEMGLTELPQFGTGVRGVFLASPSLVYELGYVHSNFAFLGLRYTSDIIEGRFKWFPGNSFYLTAGLAHRKLEGETSNFLFNSEVIATYDNSSLLADMALGNQWQFHSFTIGCDWIGVFLPLIKLSEKVDVPSKTGASASDVSSAQSDADSFRKRAKEPTVQLLRFYIGWSFH